MGSPSLAVRLEEVRVCKAVVWESNEKSIKATIKRTL